MTAIEILKSFKDSFKNIDEIYDEQIKMTMHMEKSLNQPQSVVVCQGPTGMGKSFCIDAIAIWYSNNN